MTVPVGNTYDKEAATHPVERWMVQGFASAFFGLLPAVASRVLEVGCGEGNQLDKVRTALPDARLFGVDLPEDPLVRQWDRTEAALLGGSADALPFPAGAFDLVLALEVLEHLDDPDAALAEIARVARGMVVLSVPWEPVWRAGNLARGRYVRELGNTPGHIQHFTRRGFVRRVGRHLDVAQVRRPFPWTMLLARVRR